MNTTQKSWQETETEVASVIDKFHEACQHTHGYAYESGWYHTMIVRLLMHLPESQRQQELDILQSQTHSLEAMAIVSKLMK